jgi:hypothetical protein
MFPWRSSFASIWGDHPKVSFLFSWNELANKGYAGLLWDVYPEKFRHTFIRSFHGVLLSEKSFFVFCADGRAVFVEQFHPL